MLAQGAFLTTRVTGFPDGFLMAVPGGNSPAAHTVRQAQHQPPENLGKRPCMSEKALLYQPRARLECSSFLFLIVEERAGRRSVGWQEFSSFAEAPQLPKAGVLRYRAGSFV